MSNYEKQNFVSGQILKADHLNHMEDGITNVNELIIDMSKKHITFLKQGSTVQCVIPFKEANEIISSGASSVNITLTATSVDSSNNLIIDVHKMINMRQVSSLITGEPAYCLVTFKLADGNFVTYQFNSDESVVEVNN